MNQRERIEALLADRVTEGLSPAHEAELERLLGGPVDASPEAARWEAAAAAVAVASVSADKEELPPALARALLDDAELFVAAAKREERKRARVMTTGAASAAELNPNEGARPATAAGGWLSSRWGWVAAAAACALFAAQTFRLESARGAAGGAAASSTLHVTCSIEGGGGEPAGELLWNARERQGVLVFDRSPGAAPSASGHVVYRCAPVAP
jgi:hypothetical protein